jgi:hypothetical protein
MSKQGGEQLDASTYLSLIAGVSSSCRSLQEEVPQRVNLVGHFPLKNEVQGFCVCLDTNTLTAIGALMVLLCTKHILLAMS